MPSISSPSAPDTGAYASHTLDHHGLVAGMVDELGLVGKIDALIRQDLDQRRVSVGMAVKALILMGLGFTQCALYLTPQFFADKPVERLLGAGLAAGHLNDDALGRALDAIHAYGVESFYYLLAVGVVKQLGLSCAGGHLDATSFHVDGEYNHSDEVVAEGVVHIRPGYSRDHRPDLNQVVLQLITENQAGIPLLMAASSGNINDQIGFRALVQRHIEQLKVEVGLQYLVADSALYSEGSLRELGDMVWISRVPETFGAARALIDAVADDLAASTKDTVHRAVGVVAAGVRQRWLVVYSRAARLQAEATLRRQHAKQGEIELKAFDRLRRQRFACEADAQAALEAFSQDLTLTEVQAGGIVRQTPPPRTGRPAKHPKPDTIRYAVEGHLASRIDVHARRLQRKSCFIVATNDTVGTVLDDEQAIDAYCKDQQKVERGFRFLKDPLFMASTLFLKSPERIMALMAIMTLCLLVYAALEYRIRQGLAQQTLTFPDQKGKPTQQPTARWVFLFFAGIHLLTLPSLAQVVLNLAPHHRVLLAVLGERYISLYANSG
ncbi:MAG TPA: IS1634 family transposase [Candidatus Competibacteraceae bacterium]|nr:IS1634 family transposase [Candidatus Competibacteraceae bacterium]